MLGNRNAERGGSLVEFAVILPPALILLLGIIQFGIVMFEYHATDYAAKFGARYAAVRGASCSATGCPITQAALQTAVQSGVPGAGNATVQAQWTTPPIGTYAGTGNNDPSWTCSSSSESKGCFVTVTVTNTVGLNVPFVRVHSLSFAASSTVPISQ